jgi:arylsulfatase A-like enzyme
VADASPCAAGVSNVLIFVLDDVEFGQLSCFGGLVETPVLDRFATNGLRYTDMHMTALCSPSRGAIFTGRNHHSLGLATIAETSTGYRGCSAILLFDKGMLSEMLLPHGYDTFVVGKWHLSPPEARNAGRAVRPLAARPGDSSGSRRDTKRFPDLI